MQRRLPITLCVLLTLVVMSAAANAETLVAVSQAYAEPQILVEIVKQLVEAHTDLEVDHRRNFQGASLVHAAFQSGDVDFYVSHTGTQFTGVLGMQVTEEWKDRDKVLAYVQDQFQERFDATWFAPFGFNNTYALVLNRDTMKRLGLSTMSDLAEHAPTLGIAVDQTFMARLGDGFYDMVDHYGYAFKQAVSMDYGLMYRAVAAGEVDAAVAYSTDGRIPALGLDILTDDRQFFPPYDCSLVVSNDVLEKYPIIRKLVEPLIGAIDESTMQALNKHVDVEHCNPQEVAREYLEQRGLI